MNIDNEIERFKKALADLENTGTKEVSWVVMDKNKTPESQMISVTAIKYLFPDLEVLAYLKTTDNGSLREALANLLKQLEEKQTLVEAKERAAKEFDIIVGA